MTARDARRAQATEGMADLLLDRGLGGATLRALAAAADMSDRMLLYYFADKDEALAAALAAVAARMTGLLDAALPDARPRPFPSLLAALWAATSTPALAPFMRLWLELSAAAAGGREPHRRVSGAIAEGFRDWIAARLDAPDRAAAAALILATLDGLLLLDAVGRRDLAEAAVVVAAR